MSKKYVIEIKPEYEDNFKGLMILGAKDSNLFVDTIAVENLEELNSDYINEHYGDLQDTAYQRGLEDAWNTVKKMYLDCECRKITGEYFNNYIKNHTINDAIKLFKDYEEKQYKIAVGDEVIYNGTTKCIVVRPEDDERYASLIDGDGTHYSADHRECKKTGRHFDIASILEEMKE